jgi:hypothetical protein
MPEDGILHSDRRENLKVHFISLNLSHAYPLALLHLQGRTYSYRATPTLTRG